MLHQDMIEDDSRKKDTDIQKSLHVTNLIVIENFLFSFRFHLSPLLIQLSLK